MTWSLDVAGNVKIARRGFTLATDLAGTAHSFVGATLASAIVDLGSLWQVPTHDAQLTGYVCASRVRRVTDLVVAHPYSPELFTQGDLTGPKLLLDFQRGHKSVEDVKMACAQAARAAQNRTRARDWPANLNLICISCAITIETAEEIKRPLWSFRGRGSNDLEIVQAGMDRMCKTCREKFTQNNVTQTQNSTNFARGVVHHKQRLWTNRKPSAASASASKSRAVHVPKKGTRGGVSHHTI